MTTSAPSTVNTAAAHTLSAAVATAPACHLPSVSCMRAAPARKKGPGQIRAHREHPRRGGRATTSRASAGKATTHGERGAHAERADDAAGLGERDAGAGSRERGERLAPGSYGGVDVAFAVDADVLQPLRRGGG